jgi:hypothetical protein
MPSLSDLQNKVIKNRIMEWWNIGTLGEIQELWDLGIF